ncbi:MAG: tRNA pseudouridine(38-40) synthase TruA, partial [Firmicutes bacterium]|nr:tRNA pseudouridine(38-40) synthase TruA [Bacillota bacterium]
VARITERRVNVIGCGRTDAKVHAINYVCNFEIDTTVPVEKFPHALNAHLPDDIICMGAERVSADFRANQSAKRKTYLYRILTSQYNNAFLRNYAWHYKYGLDVEKMRCAATAFLGEHDFIGFASSGFSVKTTVRTIYSLDVRQDGDIVEIEVCGNGFLYNMVRIIAGTLVEMGNGRIDYKTAEDIISSRDRNRAGITAPPQGLFLKEVFY